MKRQRLPWASLVQRIGRSRVPHHDTVPTAQPAFYNNVTLSGGLIDRGSPPERTYGRRSITAAFRAWYVSIGAVTSGARVSRRNVSVEFPHRCSASRRFSPV